MIEKWKNALDKDKKVWTILWIYLKRLITLIRIYYLPN